MLGALAIAVAVTAATAPAAASGLGVLVSHDAVRLSIPSLGLPTLSALPIPTATGPTTQPTSLPSTGVVPGLCPPSCASTPRPATSVTGGSPAAPGSGQTRSAGSGGSRTSPATASNVSGGDSRAPSASSALGVARSLGLSLSAPPPVDRLTPLAGISFGQAPYLWPLFLMLDVLAAVVVVFLVRRTTRSSASGAD